MKEEKEEKKSAKERVQEKFSLAADLKQSKIETTIDDVKKDGEVITARFRISGLPTNKKDGGMYEDSYRNFSKVFDGFDDFSKYAEKFLNTSDEELIKLAKS